MRILDIQQNTPEWLDLRRNKIGASDCPIIMRVSPYKTPLQLWEEKVRGSNCFTSAAMKRGHDMEIDARKWFEKIQSGLYDPVCVQHQQFDWMIASLDGYDLETKDIVEIKCPNAEVFKAVQMGQIPEHYIWQIQHQLAVTELERAHLLVWNGKEGIVRVIDRDEQMIQDLLEAELRFYERMVNFEPPEEGIQEGLRTDSEFLEAEQELFEIIKQKEQLEELERIHRDSLIYLAGEKSCRGKLFFVEKCPGKKVVDYKKIPQLKEIDLSPYERQGNAYWRVRESR